MSGASFGFIPDMLTMYRVHSQMGTVRHQARILPEYEMVKTITAMYLSIWLSLADNGDTMKILLATHWLLPMLAEYITSCRSSRNVLNSWVMKLICSETVRITRKSILSTKGRN